MTINKQIKEAPQSLLFDFPPAGSYAESYRTLRTNLNFSSMERSLNTVLVTSSVEAEGKTNTAINLGFTIAQSGSKVLLIDADLRKPRLTDLFSLKKNKGFTDIISRTFSARISKGTLREYSTGDLLQLIKLQKQTGQLEIKSAEHQIAIFFIDGKVIDIYWKNRPDNKKLANILIQKQIVTREEAAMALGQQKKSVQRLGTILFTMGLVSKEKLAKELAVHTVEVMRILSGITEGAFHFTPLSGNNMLSPISHNLNFEQLFAEFLGQGREEFLFIDKSIDSSIYPTKAENLYILPSGKVPPNPSEVIGSKGTNFLMDLLKKKFDFIILDTPPVMPATDALLMAARTDGTILVVKSGNTNRKIVKGVVESFKNAKLPILGILLNYVDLKKEGYYRYYKKYSSYYGE